MGELRQPVASKLSEPEVIRGAQNGDPEAFETLYRMHSRRIFALCLRMLKNSAEAEDLTQETFLTVFRTIQAFRGRSAFSTWLYRVAVNLVLMHMRKKTIPQTSLDEIRERQEESHDRRLELSAPDLNLKGLIDRLTLERAFAQLLPESQLEFVLYEILGYAHREIAQLRGCSTGNSKLQLHRTRLRLRRLIQQDQNNDTQVQHESAKEFEFAPAPSRDRDQHSPANSNSVVPFKPRKTTVMERLNDKSGESTAGQEQLFIRSSPSC